MKKILISMLICGAVFSASAQNDSANSTSINTSPTTIMHKYFYYPSSNVYFDEGSGNYWDWNNGTSKWITVQTLPSTITVGNAERYPIDVTGNDPWLNNASDLKKYKVKGNGEVKMKTEKDKQ